MKKTAAIIFLLCLIFSSAAGAAVGDVAGKIYCTDIVTYIYHSPIISYNIGGRTVIDAEALNWHYGFDVYWYEGDRTLKITDKGGSFNSLQAMNGELIESKDEMVGCVRGNYFETDIKAYLNGNEIESYNIGGRTFIVAESMRDFGYNADWNEEKRTLTITKPADFYRIETDYGTIKTSCNFAVNSSARICSRGFVCTDEDGNSFEYETASNTILAAASRNLIKLSDVAALLNAECTLTETESTVHSEWVNGICYDEPHYFYTVNLNYDKAQTLAHQRHEYSEETIDDAKVLNIDYDISDVGLIVNGEEKSFLDYGMRGGLSPSARINVANGEIYISAATAADMLGYKYGY